MAKKKKVITTAQAPKKKLKPTTTRTAQADSASAGASSLIFGRENYKWVLIGIVLIAVGMALMSGGSMPSPDVWDDSIIYSHRRLTLGPLVILAGLGVEIYAIFK